MNSFTCFSSTSDDPILYSSMSGQVLPKSSVISSTGYSATAFVGENSSPVRTSLAWEDSAAGRRVASPVPAKHSNVDSKICDIYNHIASGAKQSPKPLINPQSDQSSPGGDHHAENAARVDALLLELFPERMTKKKPKPKKDKQVMAHRLN